MEGEENTSQDVSNETPVTHTHSEKELVFVLILIGLLGIAFLAWYVGVNHYGTGVQHSETPTQIGKISVNVMASEDQGFEPISEEDYEALSLGIMTPNFNRELGEHFVHPIEGTPLYISRVGCINECLEANFPYYADESISLGDLATIIRSDNGRLQYAWHGNPLYVAIDFDSDGEHEWQVASPLQGDVPEYLTFDFGEEETEVLNVIEGHEDGNYLTHPANGHTLYVAEEVCDGGCLSDWTIYAGEEHEDGAFGTVYREDLKETQYTWKGKGLYTFNYDEKPGDLLGDGFVEGFSIARP